MQFSLARNSLIGLVAWLSVNLNVGLRPLLLSSWKIFSNLGRVIIICNKVILVSIERHGQEDTCRIRVEGALLFVCKSSIAENVMCFIIGWNVLGPTMGER